MLETLIDCVYRAIDQVNAILPEDQQLAKAETTVLFGAEGTLDSMGLINLLVEVESQVQSALGKEVSVVDLTLPYLEVQGGGLDVKRLSSIILTVLDLER